MGSSFEFRDNYPDNGIYPGYSRAAVIPIPDSWSRRLSWIGIRVLLPYPILVPLFLNSPVPAAIGGANLTELLVRAAGGVGGELTLLKMDADGALTLLLADDAQTMPAPFGWSYLQPECSSRGGFHNPLLA